MNTMAPIPLDSSPKKKMTIGFLINKLHDRYQSMVCPGIVEGARRRGCNLIMFVGKSLNSASVFENQENIIYNLASSSNIDGLLIVTGAIGNYLKADELKQFCCQYKPLPVVCLASPVEGIPSVWVDNENGMREMVTHFIEHHNYKRIAFIKGPVNNPAAELRFEVFKQVLHEHDIPVFPELIYDGNFVLDSGTEGIRTLLDKRKVTFDAVLAANDEMLIGVYRELLRRGIKIPQEAACGGFDNIDETRIISPQMTTVSQQLYMESLKSVNILVDIMEGKTVETIYTFPARLIIRQSCGCKTDEDQIIKNTPAATALDTNNGSFITEALENSIINNILNDSVIELDYPKELEDNKTLVPVYLKAFIDDIMEEKKQLIDEISKLVSNHKEKQTGLLFFKTLLSKIYNHVTPYLENSPQLSARAHDVFNSALVVLLDLTSRHNLNMAIKTQDNNFAILDATKSLSTVFDLEGLRRIVLEILPTLNISFCFIALYEDKSDVLPSVRSRVFLNYQGNKQDAIQNTDMIFDSQQIIPDYPGTDDERTNYAIFPLVNENDHFGYIVFNYDHDIAPIIYETLQGHISASLKGALFLNTVKQQAKDLQIQKSKLNEMAKLRQIMKGFINSMSLLVETRDPYTAGHQVRVADLARAIAGKMGLSKNKIEGIRISGVLHDLGKLHIPGQILNKPGKLTPIEYNLIKLHPEVAYNILKSVNFSWPIAQIVLQHHERIDGSGYPAGLKGDEILIEAQILSVADVVEAMASHRPYRQALGIDTALEEISKNRGKLYNKDVVDCCIQVFKDGFEFKKNYFADLGWSSS